MARQSEETERALIKQDLNYLKNAVDKIDNKVSEGYLSKAEFEAKFYPIQRAVYGLIGLICLGVGGAIISNVLR